MKVTLEDVNHIEPAMLDRFIVNIHGFSEFSGGDAKLSSIRAAAVDVPHVNTTSEGVFGFGTKEYFPNYTDIDSFSVSFIEDANYTITKALKRWKLAVVDANGFYGMPANYKRTISVSPLAPIDRDYPMPNINTHIPDVKLKIDVSGKSGSSSPTFLDLLTGRGNSGASKPYEVTVPGVSSVRPDKQSIDIGVKYTPPVFSLSGCFPTDTDPYTYEQNGSILIVRQSFSVDNGDIR